MKRLDRSPLGFYIIGIAALFLAGFMLLVVFGASTYCSAVNGQERNNQVRSLRAYLATCVQSARPGQVQVTESTEGPALIINEEDTGYGLRIYQHDGYLVEDYGEQDSPLQPETAETIAKTKKFNIEKASPRAVFVDTDAGRIVLRVAKEA